MAQHFFTREQIQIALEMNELGAQVSYLDREDKQSPDNYVVFLRLPSNALSRADDRIHIRQVMVQVIHFHKRKLDSIEGLMQEQFGVSPFQFSVRQADTDYLGTYYRFECYTKGTW